MLGRSVKVAERHHQSRIFPRFPHLESSWSHLLAKWIPGNRSTCRTPQCLYTNADRVPHRREDTHPGHLQAGYLTAQLHCWWTKLHCDLPSLKLAEKKTCWFPYRCFGISSVRMEHLLTQTPDTVKSTQNSYFEDKRKSIHPEDKTTVLDTSTTSFCKAGRTDISQEPWRKRPWEVTSSTFMLTNTIAVICTKASHWSFIWNCPHCNTTFNL